MFIIPTAVLGVALMKLSKWMQSKSSSGSPPELTYTFYAVPHRQVEAFADAHPDAVPYGRFAALLRQHGYSAAEADACLTQGGAMERRNPGCLVAVADIRRG